MKPIAIITADWHLHNFTESGRRLKNWRVIKQIGKVANRYKIPILFCGDMFHDPHRISSSVMDKFINGYKKYLHNIPVVAIPGNHDQSRKNTLKKKSPDYITTFSGIFPNLIVLDQYKDYTHGDLHVKGIPYMSTSKDFIKSLEIVKNRVKPGKINILLTHRDYPNLMPFSEKMDTGKAKELVDSMFKPFSIVFSGHIHIPLRIGNNSYMVGAPQQQSWRDRGIRYGYIILYQSGDSLKVKYHKFRAPEFIEHDTPEAPDNYNFYRYVEKPNRETREEVARGNFSTRLSPKRVAKNYLKALGNDIPKNYGKRLLTIMSEV